MTIKEFLLTPGNEIANKIWKKQAILQDNVFDSLCDMDKQKIIEADKEKWVFFYSIIFWSIILLASVLVLNWVFA